MVVLLICVLYVLIGFIWGGLALWAADKIPDQLTDEMLEIANNPVFVYSMMGLLWPILIIVAIKQKLTIKNG